MARYRTPDSESSSVDFIPENHLSIKTSNIIKLFGGFDENHLSFQIKQIQPET